MDIATDEDYYLAPRTGCVSHVNCREIGNAAAVLGAGRNKITDDVDHGVGLEMIARIGNEVKEGDPMVRIIHRKGRGLEECKARLAAAFTIADEPTAAPPLIYETLE